MRCVVVESPLSGDVGRNLLYLRECLTDCIRQGDSPYASHWMLTRILDDKKRLERQQGMEAGWAWMARAEAVVVYEDLGVSRGMQLGIDAAVALGVPIERRKLGGMWTQIHENDLLREAARKAAEEEAARDEP
jgi:hypothetical protein